MTTLGWLTFAVLLLLLYQLAQVCGCMAVVVGRKASADGSVLVGHNEENTGQRVLRFCRVPEGRFDDGSQVTLRHGGTVESPRQTTALLWSQNFGLESSDNFLNAHGVAVVSDGCPTREDSCELLADRGEILQGGIGLMLRRLVAQQARTAREGVGLVAQLVERFGYTSSRTYVIADPTEAWLVALVRGRRWVAERVPDDAVVALPNVYVTGQIDLADGGNFLGSPDLVDYATRRGWFDPGGGRSFDFRMAYGSQDELGPDPRQWWAQTLLTGSGDTWPTAEPLPFAVRAAEKLTVANVAALMRNSQGPRSLFHHATQETAVFQLRDNLPAAVGCVYWRTTGRPDSSVLTPWYAGIADTPAAYRMRDDRPGLFDVDRHMNPPAAVFQRNPALAWWKFAALQAAVDEDYDGRIDVVRDVWAKHEAEAFARQPAFEQKVADLFATDPQAAGAELTEYCARQALDACQWADRLVEELREQSSSILRK